MKQVTITCKGTVKHPETKKVIETFEFDFIGTEVEAITDLDADKALKMVALQHKIDQLNAQRTAYVNKKLTELGLAKTREADPRIKAIKDLLSKLPKEEQEAKFNEIMAALA